MDFKAVSDNKTYLLLYTDWNLRGLTYYHNITWKYNGLEGSSQFSLGFFSYQMIRFFGKRGELENMIHRNIEKTLTRLRSCCHSGRCKGCEFYNNGELI